MPLGWIDFSKTERNKVLSVLELLSEQGTLDELGIAPIRDGYANLFFPGTSTIQTRAKYFLIVPYAIKDLEYAKETNPYALIKVFDEIEKECGKRLMDKSPNATGIIGSRSLGQNSWVKRTPATIYWAGLRNYGILTCGDFSLSEYIRAICALKNQKLELDRLANRHDESDEKDTDDKDAGLIQRMKMLYIPTYIKDWKDNISLSLTEEEGVFLKHQIITTQPDSMLAYVLKNDVTEILAADSYKDLKDIVNSFPSEMKQDYHMALDFSDFLFVLLTLYNLIVSEEENVDAISHWERLRKELKKRSDVDLEAIFTRLGIFYNVKLCDFLKRSKELMASRDVESLKNEIRRRERYLKQNRAKSLHPGEFDKKAWFGGSELDYRFSNAKIIIRDIWESEGIC